MFFSRQPLAGGDSFKTRRVQANFSEENAHQQELVEQAAREAKELQIRNQGRQIGCLLVQRTKGETQLRATKWLSATTWLGGLEATQLELPLQTSGQRVAREL